MMKQSAPRRSRQSGYSMVELMFVMGVMAAVAGMAALQMNASRPGFQGDGAMRVVLGQMNQARELAIAQRRFMRVVFTTPNVVQIVREDTTTTTTALRNVVLESGVTFALMPNLPDTPDQFGNSSAIAFGSAIDIKFAPDGTLVNQNGASINGSVFVGLANGSPLSARAVTVLGSTGRVRGYRWDGKHWNLV